MAEHAPAGVGFLNLPPWAESLVALLRGHRLERLLTCPLLSDDGAAVAPDLPWPRLPAAAFAAAVATGLHFDDAPAPAWWPRRVITADSGFAAQRLLVEGVAATGVRAAIGGTYPLLDIHRPEALLPPPRRLLALPDGVTTFLLTAMDQDGLTLDQALAEAQWRGIAPAHATRHLHGLEARDRLCLLASAIFGERLLPADVACEGVLKLDKTDLRIAARLGYHARHLGVVERRDDGSLEAWVQPRLIPARYLLAQVRGGWRPRTCASPTAVRSSSPGRDATRTSSCAAWWRTSPLPAATPRWGRRPGRRRGSCRSPAPAPPSTSASGS